MAKTATYSLIASHTLGSNAATYTFSSITGNYTDLILVCQIQQVTDGEDVAIQFNGDTSTNYSRTFLCGSGSAVDTGRDTSVARMRLDHHATPPTGTSFSTNIINIQDYSNTTTYKTVLARAGSLSTYAGTAAVVGLWRSTAAINSITIFCTNSSNMKTGSNFKLYGIEDAK
jgi:hypothetical protein